MVSQEFLRVAIAHLSTGPARTRFSVRHGPSAEAPGFQHFMLALCHEASLHDATAETHDDLGGSSGLNDDLV